MRKRGGNERGEEEKGEWGRQRRHKRQKGADRHQMREKTERQIGRLRRVNDKPVTARTNAIFLARECDSNTLRQLGTRLACQPSQEPSQCLPPQLPTHSP